MIRVTYDRKAHWLTVKGHAGASPHGEDIVCAGVSALVCTLAEAVRCMERNKQVQQVEIKLLAGDGEIRFETEYPCLANSVADTVCLGLACLAKQYPDYVSYEERRPGRNDTDV